MRTLDGPSGHTRDSYVLGYNIPLLIPKECASLNLGSILIMYFAVAAMYNGNVNQMQNGGCQPMSAKDKVVVKCQGCKETYEIGPMAEKLMARNFLAGRITEGYCAKVGAFVAQLP